MAKKLPLPMGHDALARALAGTIEARVLLTPKRRVLKKYPKAYAYRWGYRTWHVKGHQRGRVPLYGCGPTANAALETFSVCEKACVMPGMT